MIQSVCKSFRKTIIKNKQRIKIYYTNISTNLDNQNTERLLKKIEFSST